MSQLSSNIQYFYISDTLLKGDLYFLWNRDARYHRDPLEHFALSIYNREMLQAHIFLKTYHFGKCGIYGSYALNYPSLRLYGVLYLRCQVDSNNVASLKMRENRIYYRDCFCSYIIAQSGIGIQYPGRFSDTYNRTLFTCMYQRTMPMEKTAIQALIRAAIWEMIARFENTENHAIARVSMTVEFVNDSPVRAEINNVTGETVNFG